MQFTNKLILTLVLCGATSVTYADDLADVVSEVNVRSCELASKGVQMAAEYRQNGSDKKTAKKALNKKLQTVKKHFTDKQFVGFIETSWNNGLDIVYNMPIQTTPTDKERFIEQVENSAYKACMDDLQR